jgi:iron complex outermembrane receptor protein
LKERITALQISRIHHRLLRKYSVYTPIENLHISWLQKFVGEQYMNNIELPAALDYFVNDLNVAYTFKPKSIFKEIIVIGLVNIFR